jgi:hypothetical protein
MAISRNIDSAAGAGRGQPQPDSWHLWRVLIPRRSITGRLVCGAVWRRDRGGRWEYKKVVEYSDAAGPTPVS